MQLQIGSKALGGASNALYYVLNLTARNIAKHSQVAFLVSFQVLLRIGGKALGGASDAEPNSLGGDAASPHPKGVPPVP